MHKAVSGLFEHMDDANRALGELAALGYTEADVSVITRGDAVELEHDSARGIKDAAKAGGIVGGVLGLLTGIGALTIPGVGALFIAGPITAALGLTGAVATTASGALTGALVGGLLGALKELGIDEVQAKIIEERVKEGDTLLLIYPNDEQADEVKECLESNNGKHVYELELTEVS